jgi:ABC-type glutathione transport system ATPase component
MGSDAYLAVRNLTISFTNSERPTVQGISFAIAAGKCASYISARHRWQC